MHFPALGCVDDQYMSRGKNANFGYWCGCWGQFLLGCVRTHSRHWWAVHCCRTWLKPELKHELLVNDCLLVFWYFSWDFNNNEKDAGGGCVISVKINSTSIFDPRSPGHTKTFGLIWPVVASDHGVFLKVQDWCAHLSRTQQLHGPGKILFKEATKISFH